MHRIGRTGRAGHEGVAVSLVSGDERPLLKAIERLVGQRIPIGSVPAEGPRRDAARRDYVNRAPDNREPHRGGNEQPARWRPAAGPRLPPAARSAGPGSSWRARAVARTAAWPPARQFARGPSASLARGATVLTSAPIAAVRVALKGDIM